MPYFAAFLPDDYWASLQSPLIRLELTAGSELRVSPVILHVERNDFLANHLVQPWIPVGEFQGGLLQLESVTTNAELNFNSNQFDDNYVRGGDTALIYVQGPRIIAHGNTFYRSGALDTTTYGTRDTSNQFTYVVNMFDIEKWIDYEWTQQRGIFWIRGATNATRSISYPLQYEFYDNYFEYAFSKQGAIFSHDIEVDNFPFYMRFKRN